MSNTNALEHMRYMCDSIRTGERLRRLAGEGRASDDAASEYINAGSVLEVSRTTHFKILLEMNGPTTWVDLTFNEHGEYLCGEFCTTRDSDHGRASRIDLEDSEAETFADMVGGLDYFGSIVRGEG